ncbi:MAG: hypothetical protein AAB564_02470 [Patescibacteria group bacterium]
MLLEKSKESKKIGKIFGLFLIAVLFLLAWIFFKNAFYHQKMNKTAGKENRSADVFSFVPSVFAEEPEKKQATKTVFNFQEGEILFKSGEERYLRARRIFRFYAGPENEHFKEEVKLALEDYRNALFVWDELYKQLSFDFDEKPRIVLEKIKLLDAINHVLYRVLPFVENEKISEVKEAMLKNWMDSLKLLESVKIENSEMKKLKRRLQKNFEFFRKREQNPPPPQSEKSYNFPDLEEQEDKNNDKILGEEKAREKSETEKKVRAEMKKRQDFRDSKLDSKTETTEEKELKIPAITAPNLGQFELPLINP